MHTQMQTNYLLHPRFNYFALCYDCLLVLNNVDNACTSINMPIVDWCNFDNGQVCYDRFFHFLHQNILFSYKQIILLKKYLFVGKKKFSEN